MTFWKYIGWDDSDGLPHVVVFNPTLTHAAMVPRGVIPRSAGFVTVKAVNEEACTHAEVGYDHVFVLSGHSDSLNLHPRPEDQEAFEISQ